MGIRMKNIFDPNSGSLYKLSRSQIELFVNCARCFYLDRRLSTWDRRHWLRVRWRCFLFYLLLSKEPQLVEA